MATAAAHAPSRVIRRLQTVDLGRVDDGIEAWLEAEREQLPLWIPVMLGLGIAAWFALPLRIEWWAAALGGLALAAIGLASARGGRASLAIGVAGLLMTSGVGLAWWRAERVAAPVLVRPAVVTLRGRVERVEPLPARDLVRLRLVDLATEPGKDAKRPPPTLPPRVRVNLATADVPAGIAAGAVVRLGVRLMPPQSAGVPGAYDYARIAWFDGIGATGRGYAPVTVVSRPSRARDGWRTGLTRHIEAQLPGSVGGVAAAFVTGDVGAISLTDADAMRRAGLAHLLSISGLHITAAVAATMLVVLRLLSLSPWLALRVRLPLVAAAAGAAAAIGYTLLSGAEVPTIRSCVAALLVLGALALGREAVTLRLVAAGAFVVLLLWPEALVGPSFQLSFAAVTAIVALHEHPRIRDAFMAKGDGWLRGTGRHLASLLLTGLVVEVALMPIAVYHFHKAGIYGAIANIVAIPLSTFVIMPAEALALVLDPLGLGAPAWWVTGRAIALLLWIARMVAAAPGAVTMVPGMPGGAFALLIGGGLWLALWRTRVRRWGWAPILLGTAWTLATPAPDILVSGDGRHVAVATAGGGLALLRDRAGDYTRDMMAVSGGLDGAPGILDEQRDARCSRDLCLATRRAGGRTWRILATRSGYPVPIAPLTELCRTADIVVSDRRLPRTCTPRWLTLTPATLARSGGVAITLATARTATVLTPGDEHPWARARQTRPAAFSRSAARYRKAYPGSAPAAARNAADHRRGWRDRGGPSRLRDGNI